MDHAPALGGDESSRLARQVMGQYDAPAYVHRARRVDDILAAILREAGKRRDQELAMVKVRLATLAGMLGSWDRLHVIGQSASQGALQSLHGELKPSLRAPVIPCASPRRLRRAFAELRASIDRFNRRWRAYLEQVDLGPLNQAVEAYNRYYVLEKECLVRSPAIARRGFEPKPLFTLANLAELLPTLPEPPL